MKAKEVFARLKRIFVKRKYKDILFRYVFRGKKEILQLYNAINNTNYTNADDLAITTMEDVIYVGMKNDLSFIIVNELNLYEHQSTINENMPLRGLLYFARLYESYLDTRELNRHQRRRIPLPFPPQQNNNRMIQIQLPPNNPLLHPHLLLHPQLVAVKSLIF